MRRVGFQYRHPLRVVTNAATQAVARKFPGDVFSSQVSSGASRSASLQLVGSKIGNVCPQQFDVGRLLRRWLLRQSGGKRQRNDQSEIEKLAKHNALFLFTLAAWSSHTSKWAFRVPTSVGPFSSTLKQPD